MHLKVYASEAGHKAGTRLCEYKIDPQTGLTGVHLTDNANNTIGFLATEVAVSLTKTLGTVANCGPANWISKYNGASLGTPSSGTLDFDD